MTVTEPEARETMLAHHQALEEGVKTRVDAFVQSATEGGASRQAAAELVAYLAGEVLPHAQAEEQTIYQAARVHQDLTGTLDDMIGEHRALASTLGHLADAPSGPDAVADAEQLASLFSTHVAKENEIVLPVLVADTHVELAQLLSEMHRLTETAQQPNDLPDQPTADPTAAVLSLLLKATTDLARGGEADRACELAASAWATLRAPRPELAVRVTAALHGLSRLTATEPVALRPIASGGELADPPLDVRSLAPAQRHQLIFATYEELVPGSGFVLVNDHDPKPLRYQFEAEHAGDFTWDSLEAGPTVWQVRIGRPAAPGASQGGADDSAGHGLPELDVRSLPHAQRHASIFATYEELVPGSGFVLVNDHDPKPLRYQFEAQHAGGYSWDYLEAGPTTWRVRIGRPLTH